VIRLRVYVDRRCDELQQQIDRRITDDRHQQELRENEARRNIELASARVDDRLEAMNEFRAQLDRQAGTFVTRSEVDQVRAAAADRLAELTRRLDRVETEKAATDLALAARARRAQALVGVYLGVATLVLSVIVFLANYLTSR
jgi:hypothetical protein